MKPLTKVLLDPEFLIYLVMLLFGGITILAYTIDWFIRTTRFNNHEWERSIRA